MVKSPGRDPHAGHVADVGVALGEVEPDDVVARVAGHVLDPKALDLLPALERDHVGRRDRHAPRPTVAPCSRARRGARRSPAASSARPGAGRRPRSRRPADRASGGPGPRSPRRGRGGCGSAGSRGARRSAPRAGSRAWTRRPGPRSARRAPRARRSPGRGPGAWCRSSRTTRSRYPPAVHVVPERISWMTRAPPLRAGPSLGDAHLRRALRRPAFERALPPQPRQGPDRPLGRLRPPDPDRLRPRPHPRPRRGRQGRRLDRPQGRHARAARRHPARRDEHVDDDQRHRGLAARPLRHRRRRERSRSPRAQGHDPERHHQGVPVARDVRLPARPVDAADRRHGRLQRQRDPELEPDQRLQLPPAGGRGDAGAGDRLRAVDRDRSPRRGQGPRPGRRGGLPQGLRPDLVLRQRRGALRRGAREAPGDGRDVGVDRPEPLRRHRPEAPPHALRRPGQQPRASPRRSPRTTCSGSCSRHSR